MDFLFAFLFFPRPRRRLEKDQIAATQGCQCLDAGAQDAGAGHVLDVRQVEGIDRGLLAMEHHT